LKTVKKKLNKDPEGYAPNLVAIIKDGIKEATASVASQKDFEKLKESVDDLSREMREMEGGVNYVQYDDFKII
jgi:cell division protein FtsB